MFNYSERLTRLQSIMRTCGLDAALFSVGPDLPYLTGYEAMPSERLTMLVVPAEDEPILVLPQLEAPKVQSDLFEISPWGDNEDPMDLIVNRLGDVSNAAIGDHTWTVFSLRLQDRLTGLELKSASELTAGLRIVKDDHEVATLGEAASQADRVAARIPSELAFEGTSERDLSRKVRELLLEEGHDVADFAIVGSGPNSASPHHEPGSRIVSASDVVVIDFGGSVSGYKSDTTRTFVVGGPSEAQREVHGVVAEANHAGRSAVAPGVPCEEIDRAARAVVDQAGYGEYFIHRTGHGIGLEVHEHPYMVEGNKNLLQSGMTFSVEPGIYIPGQFGVRIEDIVLCTESGSRDLNQSNRQLNSVA